MIVTLALGIGGTTAVFSVLQAVLLAPLPYEEPGQLVRFYQQEPEKPVTRQYLTGAHFTLLREEAASFEAVTAIDNYRETGLDLVRDGRAQRLRVLRVTSDYFHTLRSGLLHGPGFERRDETGSAGARQLDRRVGLEQRTVALGVSRRSVGRRIDDSIERRPVRGGGIAPEGFEDPIAGAVDAWLPYNLASDTDAENNSLSAVGRLRSGISLEQARDELASLSRSMKERWPAARLSAVVAVPLQEDLVTRRTWPIASPLHCRRPRAARGMRQRRQSRARAGNGTRERVCGSSRPWALAVAGSCVRCSLKAWCSPASAV